MYTTRFFHILASVLAVCSIGLLIIVVLPLHANASGSHSSSTSQAALPAISTSCPAPGTARAAFMPAMTLGSHPTIVYIVNEGTSSQPTFGTLKRYDVLTGGKVEIVKMARTYMVSAQVSANGQWLLFVAQSAGQTKLQLIRMDGQYLQTLYCGGPDQVQWATNQKLIVFVETSNGTESVKLLNITNGVLQTELAVSSSQSHAVIVRTWLDTTHIYLTNTQIDQFPDIIYLLDTSKGPNQKLSDLQTVFHGSFVDFDSSYSGSQLYTTNCSCGQGGSSGPSTIAVQPATGGQTHTLYSSANYAITSVRSVLPTTLLFTIFNNGPIGSDQSHNGLWKIQTNGTGLTRLTADGEGFNFFSQFPWSNVSRDGSRYVLGITRGSSSGVIYTLEYGSLKGGTPFVFASIANVELDVVGWTTM